MGSLRRLNAAIAALGPNAQLALAVVLNLVAGVATCRYRPFLCLKCASRRNAGMDLDVVMKMEEAELKAKRAEREAAHAKARAEYDAGGATLPDSAAELAVRVQAVAALASTVVSLIGEQWSPKMAPSSTAAAVGITRATSPSS